MVVKIVADPAPLTTDADGVIRVGDTRVTLDTVIGTFLDGHSAEEITELYPVLELAQVYAVIAYYLRHVTDLDAYLEERKRTAGEIRKQCEAIFPQHGLEERLLSRRQKARG